MSDLMGLSRLSHAINICRAACLSSPHLFQRERLFTPLSTFLNLMMLCAVKKSQLCLEVMRQMQSFFDDDPERSSAPSASAFAQARGKVPASSYHEI